MSGFNLSAQVQLSSIHYPSHRHSKFGQIEWETVGGPFPLTPDTDQSMFTTGRAHYSQLIIKLLDNT